MKRKRYIVIIMFIVFIMMGCRDNNETPEDYNLQYWTTDVEATGIWLVYFYHPLCGACQLIQDDIDAFHQTYKSHYPLYFLDASQNTKAPPSHLITSVPTVVVYEDNVYLEHVSGVTAVLDLLETFKNDAYQKP